MAIHEYFSDMKLTTTLFISFFLINQAFAQQLHYLYIESETKKPFYARVGQKSYNSSQAGYLVIPKLNKGLLNLVIGFPKNEWSPQPFTLEISADAGYLLRLSAESRWELVSLKDFSKVGAAEKKDPDSLQDKTKQQVPPGAMEPVNREEKVKTADPVQSGLPVPIQAIAIISRSVGVNGFTGRYHVAEIGDTVDVEIPAARPEVADTVVRSVAQQLSVDEIKTGQVPDSPPVADQPKPGEIKSAGQKPAVDTVTKPETVPVTCRAVASMNDFLRLRKNMAAQLNEEAMTEVARKFLKSKCISAQQASNLGVLYLTDQGRYAFFDTCFEHVSDPAAFVMLEKQLTDIYYINRFRAMLR